MEDLVKKAKIFSVMLVGWSILTALFGIFLTLHRAHFEITGTGKIFALSTFLYLIITVFLGLLEHGFIRAFGFKSRKMTSRILGDVFIKAGRISSLSTKKLIEVLYFLINIPREVLKDLIKYLILVIFLALLTEWLASGAIINLPTILFSGLISLFLVVLFGQFFIELAVSPGILIVRKELLQRGEKIKESRSKFTSLKTKFTFFFSASILIVLVILSFVSSLSFNVIIFASFGLMMSIIISWILYSQITETFSAVEIFTRELPEKKKALFATGSLDAEIFDLYKSLNKTAEEVYTTRRELEKSKEELEIKLEELEKFHKLTVGRELKMVELKKEIERLKGELEEKRE